MIKLSNLDKLYWKKEKITKGELIEYYAEMAPFILPYLKNRPLVLKRYPEGIQGQVFYQKEAGPYVPKEIKTIAVKHAERTVHYILAQNAKTLLYVANLGSIELHPFHSTYNHLEQPDYMIFDLDPEGISFDAVIETAQTLHRVLDALKIPNYCKTSGARGMHVYVPLKRGNYHYPEVKKLGRLIAARVHERLPKITSLERKPAKRKRKVYIDTLQNEHGQTIVCPYSVRAKPSATVSTPLSWNEVKKGLDPQDFTIKTVPKRASQKGDLFKGILKNGINVLKVLKRIEKECP